MNGMNYAFGDLYPAFGVDTDKTSLLGNPDKNDQEALNEDGDASEKADAKSPRTSYIFLAILMIVGMVIFFGAS